MTEVLCVGGELAGQWVASDRPVFYADGGTCYVRCVAYIFGREVSFYVEERVTYDPGARYSVTEAIFNADGQRCYANASPGPQ